jgi:hypothetical protein
VNELIKKILALVVSMGVVALMKYDIAIEISLLLISITALFIYFEIYLIKSTIVQAYSEALTENRIILFFIGNKLINVIVSVFFSIYMSFYLFIHVNIIEFNELWLYLVSGLLLTVLLSTAKNTTGYFFKNLPAKSLFRLSLIFTVVFVTIIVDGLYNSMMPIDSRITVMFDKDIPLYVIEDIEHSFVYLQHLLRTALYFKLNIQSIEKSEDIGEWISVVKFILLLSPTPYIAFSLLYLSVVSIIENKVLVRKNNA